MMGLKNKVLSKSNQFNFYKENYEKLSAKNKQLIEENKRLSQELDELKKTKANKDMFNLEKRGTSGDEGKAVFVDWVTNNVEKNERILDIGFGSGVYGKILKAFFSQRKMN